MLDLLVLEAAGLIEIEIDPPGDLPGDYRVRDRRPAPDQPGHFDAADDHTLCRHCRRPLGDHLARGLRCPTAEVTCG